MSSEERIANDLGKHTVEQIKPILERNMRLAQLAVPNDEMALLCMKIAASLTNTMILAVVQFRKDGTDPPSSTTWLRRRSPPFLLQCARKGWRLWPRTRRNSAGGGGDPMLAPYLAEAVVAPLADRPNHCIAEIRFIAERDHCSLFGAALELLARDRLDRTEPELQLPGNRHAVGRELALC